MKLTKKQYAARHAELTRTLAEVNTALANMQAKYDAGEIEMPISEEIGAHWNRLHDAEWDLQQSQRALDREWERRNWTSHDWQQWDLVTSNID
jgi:hypothetical protein